MNGGERAIGLTFSLIFGEQDVLPLLAGAARFPPCFPERWGDYTRLAEHIDLVIVELLRGVDVF